METYTSAQDVTWQFPLVGDKIEILLYDVEPRFAEGFRSDVEGEAYRLQGIFNLYDGASELNALNSAGKAFPASAELLDVLRLAIHYCELTNGRYDITHGRRFLARKRGEELPQLDCTFRDVLIEGGSVALKHPDCLLDLGSVAKGYIVDRLLDYLKDLGIESAFIDARGDMAIMGGCHEIINIQHPRENRKLHPFRLENRAVATSGDYRQFSDSFERSHLVGSQRARSVTVVAPTLAEADILATVLFLVKREEWKRFLPAHAQAAIVMKETQFLNGFEELMELPCMREMSNE